MSAYNGVVNSMTYMVLILSYQRENAQLFLINKTKKI